ncbi:extracellular solute-binding protein [Arthrobacter zhangbolii]|uniref:Extracellular solute-binding protein n=1 Tax=Arthrobacter zhangbolii TaxID=2886936 RepID=A0A9X1MBA3_9MICC|nr:extracellular solute-binding protein [Arthrobacter zhangbolii]MCC3273679.1 extracellular solute-binding protein [Arthrobacter zhangbolii]UON92484.1 extracellular solute-binding protein [Arthrobacter zhangbolii]
MNTRYPDRRQFLRGALAAAVTAAGVGAVAGCGSPGAGSGSRTPVTVWDPFQGSDGANMRGIIADIQERTGLSVEPTTLSWGSPYYTKLAMSSASQQPPDAAIMHLSRMPGYAPGGLLEPWDTDLLAELGVSEKDFAPAVWESCQYEGKLYSLPLDTHPFISFFNQDLAERAGVLASDGTMDISSPEQLEEVGAKLAEATGGYGISFGYLMDTAQAWRLFWGLYRQTGGEWSLEPGGKAGLDEDKAAQVIGSVASWMDGKALTDNLDYEGGLAAFNGGRVGMILSGVWEVAGLSAAVPNLGAMPMPTMFGTPAAYADSHSYVLPRQRSMTAEHRRSVYEFVTSVIRDGGPQWGTAGHIPAYLPAQDTAEYRDLRPQSDYAAAGANVVFDPPAWFAGAGTDFQNQMSQALADAFRGLKKPMDAVGGMLSAMDRFLAAPNPTA